MDAKRDWGYANEYVKSMWKMLQQKTPDDYVIATGKSSTVRKFVEKSFKVIGKNIQWRGKGLKEVGYDINTKKILVKIDKNYFRPNEVNELRGDFKKAKKILKWMPQITLDEMIKRMIMHDIQILKKI